MQELVKVKELATVLRVDAKTVRATAVRQHWPLVRLSSGAGYVLSLLPVDIRFAVEQARRDVLADRQDGEDGDNLLLKVADSARDKGQDRAALIYEYQQAGMRVPDFVEAYNAGSSPVLFRRLGTVTVPTFYRWLKAWKEQGAGGVIPKYGMNRGGAGESLTEEEKDLLKHFWLRNTQPTAMHAYRLMKANIPYSTCTYQTALRYLNSIPKMISGYWRQGAGRFENLFLPHMEQRLDRYKSLDVVVSDHHCLDCVVLYKGKLVRPWLTTFQDLRSGKILGWCPSVKPSSLSIVVAYYMCCIRYGIPRGLLFDNGKDYRSKWLNGHKETVTVETPEKITEETEVEFEGVFAMVGSDVRFTRTYNGKSKARQERFFRIIGEYFAKDFGSYVGSDSRSRPDDVQLYWRNIDGKAKRQDMPVWEDFVSSCGKVIELINDTFESCGPWMKGKTRSRVFEENLPRDVRKASREVLQKALSRGRVQSVGRNGVKVCGANYWSEELAEFFGRKIRVYSSLASDAEVMCADLDGRFICMAKADWFCETGDLGGDIARLEGARKRLTAYAEAGSGEVKASPEYETMLDVAEAVYSGESALPDVDRFLDETTETKNENKAPALPEKKTNKLVSPLGEDPVDKEALGWV